MKNFKPIGGPGEPPSGFITPTNSKSEWYIYWAMCKILKFPRDSRIGPFTGFPGLWTYQSPFEGGRVVGGQVIDFVVDSAVTGRGALAIRITTDRYHVRTDFAKQAQDRLLQARLGSFFRVVDIYEQDYIMDSSGQAAILETKRVLFGGRAGNPIDSGGALRLRAA
jgi:hypothetical protein